MKLLFSILCLVASIISIIVAQSCGQTRARSGDGAMTIYVSNQAKENIICLLTIDGHEIPTPMLGAGAHSTATLPRMPDVMLAHLHIQDYNNREIKSEIDIDLTKIHGSGEQLHFDIVNITQVSVYFKHVEQSVE